MTGNAAGTQQVVGRVIGTVISPGRLERARKLSEAGFVHVTGLPAYNQHEVSCYHSCWGAFKALERNGIKENGIDEPQYPKPYVIQAQRRDLGHYDYNNGKTVVVTDDGEVWLGVGGLDRAIILQYASKAGAFVPCSNGESIEMHLLLERVRDPYADCNGHHSPVPQIKG